jgi:hypothetical protein
MGMPQLVICDELVCSLNRSGLEDNKTYRVDVGE